ncbi:hypothetical protein FIV38_12010, partial [Pseudomonas proteolytica]
MPQRINPGREGCCGERACPALGCEAAPKPAATECLIHTGAASQPSAGDAAFRQARSPQGRSSVS